MVTNGDGTDEAASREDLRSQLELLAEENRQLRDSYTRAKQTQYRRTAVGLVVLGCLGVVGGLLVTGASTVLFVLGAIGLFSGLLTYYLTPERFVSADVGQAVYSELAANEAALVDELGLSDRRIYVPATTDQGSVRLYVPQDDAASVPDRDHLDRTVVVTDDGDRGVALDPAGRRLFQSFSESLTGELAAEPAAAADQLIDSLRNQFELIESASVDAAAESDRLVLAVNSSVYGPLTTFDHPVVSLVAIGVAEASQHPVSVDVQAADGRADFRVTYDWTSES